MPALVDRAEYFCVDLSEHLFVVNAGGMNKWKQIVLYGTGARRSNVASTKPQIAEPRNMMIDSSSVPVRQKIPTTIQ